MLYVISCTDKPDHGQVRQENRPAHLDYLKGKGATLRLAGPYTADDGEAVKGSMIVVDVADRTAAQAIAAGDPYAKAGLFESVEIRAFRCAIGTL